MTQDCPTCGATGRRLCTTPIGRRRPWHETRRALAAQLAAPVTTEPPARPSRTTPDAARPPAQSVPGDTTRKALQS